MHSPLSHTKQDSQDTAQLKCWGNIPFIYITKSSEASYTNCIWIQAINTLWNSALALHLISLYKNPFIALNMSVDISSST